MLKGSAALPLAAVLASPGLARAAAESTREVHLTLADGRQVGGALALPEGQGRAGILLIHEWWGLNDQIRAVAVEFARLGFVALAADLLRGQARIREPDHRPLRRSGCEHRLGAHHGVPGPGAERGERLGRARHRVGGVSAG